MLYPRQTSSQTPQLSLSLLLPSPPFPCLPLRVAPRQKARTAATAWLTRPPEKHIELWSRAILNTLSHNTLGQDEAGSRASACLLTHLFAPIGGGSASTADVLQAATTTTSRLSRPQAHELQNELSVCLLTLLCLKIMFNFLVIAPRRRSFRMFPLA